MANGSLFRFKAKVQHWLNPLHVYCRLIPLLGKRRAMVLAHLYEAGYRRLLARDVDVPRPPSRTAVTRSA